MPAMTQRVYVSWPLCICPVFVLFGSAVSHWLWALSWDCSHRGNTHRLAASRLASAYAPGLSFGTSWKAELLHEQAQVSLLAQETFLAHLPLVAHPDSQPVPSVWLWNPDA